MQRPGTPNLRSIPNGFSLLEVILVIILLGILVAFGSNMLSDGVTVSKRANQDSAALTQTRTAMERLTREIREISWDANAGAYEVTTMQATRLVFIRRTGGVVTTVTIEYLPVSQQLTLFVTGSGVTVPQTLLTDVTSFQFTYRNASRGVATSSGQLRLVEMNLIQGLTAPPLPFRTHVGLRYPQ